MRKTISILILCLVLLLTFNSTIYAGAPKKAFVQTIKGTIEGLNFKQNQIIILDYNGKRHTAKVLPSTILSIEGVWVDFMDLYFGQEVEITLEGKNAKKIIAYPEEDPERYGYIMPGNRFKSGDVLFISQNQIEIKGKSGREKYRITPATTIIKNGGMANLFQVKPGDKVVLTFDDIYSAEVSSLRVQDEEKHIAGILRGKIHSVDEKKKIIYIKSPRIYKEGKGWETSRENILSLKLSKDNLYNGGETIPLRKLKDYRNQEAYIAYDEAYGNKNIAKLQIKKGSPQNCQATVEDIEYGTGKMVVNKNLIHFHPGTIVIQNNRLVDVLNIDRKKDVFVNADRIMGNTVASFVSIEGTSILDDRIDDTKLVVYRGKIEDIYEYEVKIGKLNYRLDHMKLTNNKWTQLKESERFELSEDTLIYDSQLKQTIPANQFISSRYINVNDIKDPRLRERVRNNFYKNKTAYFIVRESAFGKELLGLNITPHINEYRQNVNTTYSTIGEIEEIDYDKGTINFTKVKNYNTLNNRWENGKDEEVDINQGLILLNDIPIPEDKIYALRKGAKAYIIKNKESSLDKGYVILIED